MVGAHRVAAGEAVDVAWLIGVARHKLIDHWRARRRGPHARPRLFVGGAAPGRRLGGDGSRSSGDCAEEVSTRRIGRRWCCVTSTASAWRRSPTIWAAACRPPSRSSPGRGRHSDARIKDQPMSDNLDLSVIDQVHEPDPRSHARAGAPGGGDPRWHRSGFGDRDEATAASLRSVSNRRPPVLGRGDATAGSPESCWPSPSPRLWWPPWC